MRFFERCRLILTAVPVCFAILLSNVVKIEAHHFFNGNIHIFFIWVCTQGIGYLLVGLASDLLCRKRVLILTQVLGAISLLLLYLTNIPEIMYPLVGLLFHPYAVGLAGLIDNFPKSSKVKLAAITFMVSLVPWCFFSPISAHVENFGLLTVVAIGVNIALTEVFFFDKRDEKLRSEVFSIFRSIHKHEKGKFLLSYVAFFFTQIPYFLVSSSAEFSPDVGSLYQLLFIGTFFGLLFSLFYSKIPHVSILTLTYGIAFLLSLFPLIYIYLIRSQEINVYMHFLFIACLGGFFIPFVYDVLLKCISPAIRGTACGLVEFTYTLPHIIAAFILDYHLLTIGFLSIAIPIAYLMSVFLQKRAEVSTT